MLKGKRKENVKKNKAYVLDTSAIFCLKDNEDGALKVEEILEEANREACEVYLSFMSLMEYLYIALIRYGEDLARKAYLELSLLPIKIIESNEEIRLIAAEFKANYNISVADAWIAATAANEGAILVHKDPEYESLHNLVKCQCLPYK